MDWRKKENTLRTCAFVHLEKCSKNLNYFEKFIFSTIQPYVQYKQKRKKKTSTHANNQGQDKGLLRNPQTGQKLSRHDII